MMRTFVLIAGCALVEAQPYFRGFRLPLQQFPMENTIGMNAQTDASSSIMSFSSSSVLGEDGQMHTETHKVMTSSSDGLEQRKEVTCKDGACSETVSIMGRLSAMVRCICAQMQDLPNHAHTFLNRMGSIPDGQERPMHIHFLAPRSAHPVILLPAEEAQMAPPPPTLQVDNASETSLLAISMATFGASVALILVAYMVVMAIRSCLGKQQGARTMQALGEPLVDSAELGMAGTAVSASAGVVRQATVLAVPSKPAQAYLFDVYSRAGAPSSEAELAGIVLRGIYAKAA